MNAGPADRLHRQRSGAFVCDLNSDCPTTGRLSPSISLSQRRLSLACYSLSAQHDHHPRRLLDLIPGFGRSALLPIVVLEVGHQLEDAGGKARVTWRRTSPHALRPSLSGRSRCTRQRSSRSCPALPDAVALYETNRRAVHAVHSKIHELVSMIGATRRVSVKRLKFQTQLFTT